MGVLPLPAAPISPLVLPPPALPGGLSLLSGRVAIMGILNVTPDPFSDEGRYTDITAALHYARAMAAAGVGLIDMGGESTRPGSTRISADEEQTCICTIVESSATDGVIVSMGTLHAPTTREVTCVGAAIINDVSGGYWGPEVSAAVAESGCARVVQRYRALLGMPGEHFDYGDDFVGTLIEHVGSQTHDAIDAGVTTDKTVVDPGLDFSLMGD